MLVHEPFTLLAHASLCEVAELGAPIFGSVEAERARHRGHALAVSFVRFVSFGSEQPQSTRRFQPHLRRAVTRAQESYQGSECSGCVGTDGTRHDGA